MENRQTVLYNEHLKREAKMAPFGGFIMPIQYHSIIEEHKACRESVAIFDTCHMGEIFISGKTALKDLETIVSCSVETMEIGQCRYGFICNNEGGVVDDMVLYRLSGSSFMMVVNAGTRSKDVAWIEKHSSCTTTIIDSSDDTAKIDIQGPESARVVEKLLDNSISELTFYRFMENSYKDKSIIVSRTGYTGEIGFEIYIENERAFLLWNEAIELGAIPAGLGARDTLRLEMGMPLYGHELHDSQNPLETGYKRAVDLSKEFVGKEALKEEKQVLSGVLFEGRQKPQDGEILLDEEGREVGQITSGGFSPSLNCGIALAYIDITRAQEQSILHINRKRKPLKGSVTSLPFYKEATGRKKLVNFL